MANKGRIDVHAHSMSPAYRSAIQAIGGIIRTPDWSPDMALTHMDRHGTATGILSLSTPGTFLDNAAKARDLAKRVNDEHAGYIHARSTRGWRGPPPKPSPRPVHCGGASIDPTSTSRFPQRSRACQPSPPC